MTNTGTALAVSGTSLVVAVISGAIAVWNAVKSHSNALNIEEMRGTLATDLERLKATLSHSRVVSSTQWEAEFSSYQALWKAIVAVRGLANKIVLREEELTEIGLPYTHLSSPDRTEVRKNLVEEFVSAGVALFGAVHNNAPFYPVAIRKPQMTSMSNALTCLRRNWLLSLKCRRGWICSIANHSST